MLQKEEGRERVRLGVGRELQEWERAHGRKEGRSMTLKTGMGTRRMEQKRGRPEWGRRDGRRVRLRVGGEVMDGAERRLSQ